MKTFIKSILLLPIFSVFAVSAVQAEEMQPVIIELTDLNLGTDAYNSLVEYSNGGHSTIGEAVTAGGATSTTPGIGIGVGSGGNGYRPNISIVIWTTENVNRDAALAAILALVNTPSNPVITTGDCEIACDGSGQSPTPVVLATTTTAITQTSVAQPAVQSAPVIESQPVSEPVYIPVTTTTQPIVLNQLVSTAGTQNVQPIEKVSTTQNKNRVVNNKKKRVVNNKKKLILKNQKKKKVVIKTTK